MKYIVKYSIAVLCVTVHSQIPGYSNTKQGQAIFRIAINSTIIRLRCQSYFPKKSFSIVTGKKRPLIAIIKSRNIFATAKYPLFRSYFIISII